MIEKIPSKKNYDREEDRRPFKKNVLFKIIHINIYEKCVI